MDRRLYWIWLQQALGPGNPRADSLLRAFGDARGVYGASGSDLESMPLSHAERGRITARSLDEAADILKRTLDCGGWLMTPEDRLFPPLLRGISGMPLALYGLGEMPDLELLPSITVVGTRELSAAGCEITAMISAGLAMGGAAVVSGGAKGGDAIAHNTVMECGGITVAVQACGIDVNYPAVNQGMREKIVKTGAVLSEFPPGIRAFPHHFQIRNRIMSGMTLGTCVTEAPLQSGALITARHALEQGRDVFAVAGDILTGRSEGTSELIRDGARLVRSAEEILEEYKERFYGILSIEEAAKAKSDPRFRHGIKRNIPPPAQNVPDAPLPEPPAYLRVADETAKAMPAVSPELLSENAKAVYNVMASHFCRIDMIIDAVGLNARQVMAALTELEIGGRAQAGPGQTYKRI